MNQEQEIFYLKGKFEAYHNLLGYSERLDEKLIKKLDKIEERLNQLNETP